MVNIIFSESQNEYCLFMLMLWGQSWLLHFKMADFFIVFYFWFEFREFDLFLFYLKWCRKYNIYCMQMFELTDLNFKYFVNNN